MECKITLDEVSCKTLPYIYKQIEETKLQMIQYVSNQTGITVECILKKLNSLGIFIQSSQVT
jgi:hypothetical protein